MGFAAGMRAGQLAVEGAIDQYNQVKRARQMREVEEQIKAAQQANAERQYGIGTQDATTGMTGAQQQQAVMPQAPSATGLSPEQQAAMVGMGTARQLPPVGLSNEQRASLGLPPNAAAPDVITSATGLSPEQLAGAMQEPRRPTGEYVPMSESAVERLRADKLRGLGYTDEADKALGRAVQMEQTEYQKQQDVLAEERAMRGEGRADERLKLAQETTALQNELTALNIDFKDLELDSMRRISAASDAYSTFKGTPMEFRETPEFKALDIKDQQAMAQGIYGVDSAFQEIGSARLDAKMQKAKTLDDLATMVSDDNEITPDEVVKIEKNEKTGAVDVVYYNDIGAHPNFGKEVMRRSYPNEAAARANFQETVQDPFLGAQSYAAAELSANKLAAERFQQGIENMNDFMTLRKDLVGELLGDYGSYANLSDDKKAQIDGAVFAMLAPYAGVLGVSGEDMGGGPDAPDSMRGGSAPAKETGLGPTPDKKYGATLDEIIGTPTRAVIGAIGGGVDYVQQGIAASNVDISIDRNIREGRPLTNISDQELMQAAQRATGERQGVIAAELARRRGTNLGK